MANQSVISRWHIRDTEFQTLLETLQPGDLIEFQRENYCHWAVYIGLLPIEEDEKKGVDDDDNDDGLLFTRHPMVVHRANPAEPGGGGQGRIGSMSFSQSSFAQGTQSISIEKLFGVWSDGLARINNGLDDEVRPFDQETIVERACSAAFTGHESNLLRCYNVITNNCEHFATWARNGWAISQQVTRRLKQGMQLGAIVVVGLLPRPISLAAGLGVLGLQALHEARRQPPPSP